MDKQLTPNQRRIIAHAQHAHRRFADKPLHLGQWSLNMAASETIDARDVMKLADLGYFRTERGPFNHVDYYATDKLLAARDIEVTAREWQGVGWKVFFADDSGVIVYHPTFRAAFMGSVDGGRWMGRVVLEDETHWRQLDQQSEATNDPWLLRQCYIRSLACYCAQLPDSLCDFCTGLRAVTNEVLAEAVTRAVAADRAKPGGR